MSTVVRLVNDAPSSLGALRAVQDRLDRSGEWEHYPVPSMHVSLLGCTLREHDRQADQVDRLARIAGVVRARLSEVRAVSVTLGRLNLMGPQAFVDVVPTDGRWADARLDLADGLREIGETPMSHPDAEPIHLNISRLAGRYEATELVDALTDESVSVAATIELATVELVVTDFGLTPALTTFVETFSLVSGAGSWPAPRRSP